MKKRIAIVIVLIILTMIIGFERIGRGLQFLISDNRTKQVNASEVSTEHGNRDSRADSWPRVRLEREDSHFPALPSKSSDLAPHQEQVAWSDDDQRGVPVAIDVAGDLSPMHFIRSSAITGSFKHSSIEVERLRRALSILGEGLNPKALIFDADALSLSQAPVILFAREGLDLTEQAKSIYERLLAEDESAAKTTNVEQDR
jgi:hypothetical protein